jgi:lysophospholipase L1-like esterase
MPVRFSRYVAIGDSTTEGIDDPDGQGGFRGWADRLAERIAAEQGELLYANLAVRGRLTRQIRAEQLAPALALAPDLATVVTGMNDLLHRRFDAAAVAADVFAMQEALIARGATVLSFTLPDLGPVMPIARLLRQRTEVLNAELRRVSARSGAILIDLAAHPVASDARLWSTDRLHANADGHARIAEALAHALGLAGADEGWARPLPEAPHRTRRQRLAAELVWGREYLVPWLLRRLRRQSSGDGRGAKRPGLVRVQPGAGS